jgi:hypothetical protein
MNASICKKIFFIYPLTTPKIQVKNYMASPVKNTPKKKEDLTLRAGDEVVHKGYSAELMRYFENKDDASQNEWLIMYSDGSTALVKATSLRRPKKGVKVFNPKHKDDFFDNDKSGQYDWLNLGLD